MGMKHKNALTTVVSYPDRGTGVSNTTGDAAASMGITSHTYDLHSGFDLLHCDIPERSQFVFWHPPYWDVIKYSDVMYKAADVQARYGYDPRQFDLSRISNYLKRMNRWYILG